MTGDPGLAGIAAVGGAVCTACGVALLRGAGRVADAPDRRLLRVCGAWLLAVAAYALWRLFTAE